MGDWASVIIPKEKVNETRMWVIERRGEDALVWVPVNDESKSEVKKMIEQNPTSLSSKLTEALRAEVLEKADLMKTEIFSLIREKTILEDKLKMRPDKDSQDRFFELDRKISYIQGKINEAEKYKQIDRAIKEAMGELQPAVTTEQKIELATEKKVNEAIAEALGIPVETLNLTKPPKIVSDVPSLVMDKARENFEDEDVSQTETPVGSMALPKRGRPRKAA